MTATRHLYLYGGTFLVVFIGIFPTIIQGSHSLLDLSASSQLLQDLFVLPYYVFRSLLRMFVAYTLSLLFGITYGIVAATRERASHIMIPILDILQSVPVLGFLPAAILFFVYSFPGVLGLEVASILLIFTSMTWAVVFGVIAGVHRIPRDIKEAATAYGVRRLGYVKEIVLPAIFPELVSGSILAWGGGWYFLVACEYMNFGNQRYTLPGLGFYLASAAYQGDMPRAFLGLTAMVVVIVFINRIVWHPLMEQTDKYKYDTISASSVARVHEIRVVKAFRKYENRLESLVASFVAHERAYLVSRLKATGIYPTVHLPGRPHLHDIGIKRPHWNHFIATIISIGIVMTIVSIFLRTPIPTPKIAVQQIHLHPEALNLPYYSLRSLARLSIAYAVALGWTLVVGITTARSPRLMNIFTPLFDLGQSIPATALFPFIVVYVIDFFGGSWFGQEIASILLLLTGMQWYLLFNIIGAVHTIPNDVTEAARAFGYKGFRFVREIILPAIFPAIIVGSMQAWGGGWNASIVSEYINFGDKIYELPGLGYFLDKAAWQWGSTTMVLLSLATMTGIILCVNRLVWRRLMANSERFKFEY